MRQATGRRATWSRLSYPDPAPWAGGFPGPAGRAPGGYALRVSDAERAEVADRLARHYSEGRLDKAEFDDRVSRAMAATTVADFQGLFDDLPGEATDGIAAGGPRVPGTPPPPSGRAARRHPRGPRRGPVRTLLLVVVILAAISVAGHVLTSWLAPVLWLAVIGAVLVLAGRRARSSG